MVVANGVVASCIYTYTSEKVAVSSVRRRRRSSNVWEELEGANVEMLERGSSIASAACLASPSEAIGPV